MSVKVYAADLRHNYSGVLANDCMPLGVGYIKAVMDRELPEVRSRLFAYPDRLAEAIQSAPPDVLMLSNYMWSEQLSLHFARMAKKARPQTLVVMGGPNIFLENHRKIEFLNQHPEIDLYVLGEADFLATEVMRQFLDAGCSIPALGAREIPSAIYRRPNGEVVLTPMWARHRGLDEIPSPWLLGLFDEFFDGHLAPMIETNRGCPFTCTFCVQGVSWYTKVNYFSKDRLRDEIDYIGARIQERSPQMGVLRIADSNYGMFERDVEISGFIGEAQRKYGWPTFIDATTGKNKPERIIESLEKVSGALVLYQAVQSLDDRVLREVKRANIKKEAYEQIMIHVRGRGLRSLSDLILGLPGETLQSHIESIHTLLDAGTNEMHNFQAMMLKGSEMETLESRRKFAFETRFRVLPKNFGEYGGERAFDMDEIVVATDTLPFDDYVKARQYHLACSIFMNNSWFDDAISLAASFGWKRSQWLDAIVAAMDADTGVVGKLLRDFSTETVGELFPTEQACREFYARDENFQRLREGEIGDNLMYKYRAIASFFEWDAICGLALSVTRRLLLERGAALEIADFEASWQDFSRYAQLRHAHGSSLDEILLPAKATLHYDIQRWLAAGMPRDLNPFRLSGEQETTFQLTEDGERELRAGLKVWSTTLKGLTKGVTRIRNAAQVRVPQLAEARES
jgi:radical SAM superfamily enzyme YgiQ (UPF0313 family)